MSSCTPLCTRPRPCLYSAHVLYRHIHGSLSKTWSSMAGGHCHIVRVAVEKQMSLSKCMFAAANAALQLGGDNLSRQADFCSRQVFFFVFPPMTKSNLHQQTTTRFWSCKTCENLPLQTRPVTYKLQVFLFFAAGNVCRCKKQQQQPKNRRKKKQQQQQTNDDAGLSMQS